MQKLTHWKIVTSLVLLLLSALCLPEYVQAQTKTLRGLVKDESGEALMGVSVKIKGTGKGVVTSSSGTFTIAVGPNDRVLVFSFIGFQNQELLVPAGSQVLNVTLKMSSTTLQEAVVDIGYGTVRKTDLTGSVGTVSVEDLVKAPVKSFDEALAGRVAGVQVNSSEGQPGSDINIVIRGSNSITGNNSPLFVIDGFPMENAKDMVVNPINTIDPNDIESIDVLKDASATAIFGARGANGVIIVTTKRGKMGRPIITYNGYYGQQENKNRMDVLNPYEFVKLQNEIDPVRTQSFYFLNGQLNLDSYKNVSGINWEDQVSRKAPMQSHYVSLSGGSNQTRYSASMSYLGQDGIILNSGFNRVQGRFSLDQTVSDKLKVGLNATFSNTKMFGAPTSSSNYSNTINLLYAVWAYRPVEVSGDEDLLNEGADNEAPDYRYNPLLTTREELRETFSNSVLANGFAEYAFTKDLKLRVAGSYTKGLRRYDVFNGPLSRSAVTGSYGVAGGKYYYESSNWMNTNTLTYDKKISRKHSLNVVAGMTVESGLSENFSGYATLLPNEVLGLNGLDEGTPYAIGASSTKWRMMSFLGRANYTFNSRYLFTASLRADGSTRFQDGNVWGYFPSAAFAWRLSSEKFMKKLSFISNAKVRTSWGATGNNGVGNFASYAGLNISTTSGYMFGNTYNAGTYLSSLGNRNLKWEPTYATDLGIDLGFLKDRISFTFDVYRKNTDDLLLNADLPPSAGYAAATKNIGKVRNEGLEFQLSVVPFDKKFRWSADFNISFNRNKVLSLAENQRYMLTSQYWGDDWINIFPYIARINQPIAMFYGHVYDGVYGYGDFDQVGSNYVLKANVTANGESRSTILPGDSKYKDLNGDLLITEADKVVIGNPNPKHIGGFNNNFSYKGFDLSVFFQWSYGNDILNANRIMLESGNLYNTNQFAAYANRWSPENQDSDIPAAKGSTLKTYSSRFIEDGSFLRLKTVSLGYNLPSATIKSIKMSALRVYVTAQNLYTWTSYSGYDPEVSVRNSALTPGFDYSAYPRARTIVFGLKATL